MSTLGRTHRCKCSRTSIGAGGPATETDPAIGALDADEDADEDDAGVVSGEQGGGALLGVDCFVRSLF